MSDEIKWLSVNQAAEMLNVGIAVIKNAINRKELNFQRMGPKVIRINLEDLELWLKNSKNKSWNPKWKKQLTSEHNI